MSEAESTRQRVAVVTGGCRGVGRGVTTRLARDGATVYAWDLQEVARDAKDELEGLDVAGSVKVMVVDVANEQAVEEAVGTIGAERTGVDILVNNAGISPKTENKRTPPDETTTAEWDLVLGVNLRGPFFTSRAVIPHMKRSGWGRIVNISSLAGRSGAVVAGLPYGVAKTGINGLTRTLARHLGPDGITVNSIAPGWIHTPMTDHASEEVREQRRQNTPVRRAGTPHDIAGLVAYLCSDEAGFITGDTIDMNGGSYMAP